MQEALKSEDAQALGLKQLLEAYERQLIESALAAADGNQRRAAAYLGVLPTTLHEKMKRLGLLRRGLEAVPRPGEMPSAARPAVGSPRG